MLVMLEMEVGIGHSRLSQSFICLFDLIRYLNHMILLITLGWGGAQVSLKNEVLLTCAKKKNFGSRFLTSYFVISIGN